MRRIISMICALAVSFCAGAQSKVFKEVSDEISSKMKIITQDNALVGYLVFTQLEKTSEDSFSYKISIMDENLNDIGTVKFKEEKLDLQAVSFESDVLCLAYLKSDIEDQKFKNNRSYEKAAANAQEYIVTQFLGLDGKIIKTSQVPVDAKNSLDVTAVKGRWVKTGTATLKHDIQVRNVAGKGFAIFFGDEDSGQLLAYSLSGEKMWKKGIGEAQGFVMLTSGSDIYLLNKQKVKMLEGGYQVNEYGFGDSVKHETYYLKDKQDHELRVLSFANDPTTGTPVITGNIIGDGWGNTMTAKSLSQGKYSGVFTVALTGTGKKERTEQFSYWDDGSLEPEITKKGRFADSKLFCNYTSSFRDFQGNTYFAGPAIVKKTKWGTVAASVILAPLVVVSPILLGGSGTQKFKAEDAMLLKQDAKGALTVENTIPCNSTGYILGKAPSSFLDTKSFYNVVNTDNKSNYMIVDDTKDIVIYNVNNKKVVRTVSHKDGRVRTNIFPAKEGHIMVQEYSLKDKYLKLSIEAL